MLKILLILALVMGLGCTPITPATQTVTMGVPITDELIASIEKGKTTKPELIARIGRPSTSMGMPDGTSIATWSYTQSERRGAQAGNLFAPNRYVMPVTDSRALSVTFDEKGVVKTVTHADHHFGDTPIAIENKPLP